MAQPTPIIHTETNAPAAATERCEFCSAVIAEAHGHVVDVRQRSLLCACRACYLLFRHDGAGGGRFRAIPDRYVRVATAASDEAWDPLHIPSGLAFFFTAGATGRTMGVYPSPAGATESELTLDAWHDAVELIPQLASLSPDVEALLVRRTEDTIDALIVPIDACYELVGRIRRCWRSVHAGDEIQREVDAFFARADDLLGR